MAYDTSEMFALALLGSGGWTVGLSGAVALSAVTLVGYLFGRSQRAKPIEAPAPRDLQRAMRIACQLEAIADDLRQDLARHRNRVDRFKAELRQAEGANAEEAWPRLCQEADKMVGPTLELVSQLSTAYDKIRQQSQSLANFTGGRTDPLTGLANSRSLEEHIDVLLRSRSEGGGESAVVVVSVDDPPGTRGEKDRQAREVGQHLARTLRGEDFAARFGVDEFVVVLPGTMLAGACIFGRRLRNSLDDKLGVSVCCGLAQSMPADTPKSLLARADSAGYSARAAGKGRQFVHTGAAIQADADEGAATAPPSAPPTQAAATTVNAATAAGNLGLAATPQA
ncbi:MAG: GGDEF domain-containing protein [Planctomycetota bacterium]